MGDFVVAFLLLGLVAVVVITVDAIRDPVARGWLRRRWWVVALIGVALAAEVIDRIVNFADAIGL